MRIHPSVRALVYSLVAATAAALVLSGLTIYLRGSTVPHTILNLRIVETVASRWGVRYSLESLQIGCLAGNCVGEVNAGGITVELQTPVPFRIHLNDAEWRRADGFSVSGLEVQYGDRPPLISVDDLQTDPTTQQARVNGLRIGLLPNSPPVVIESVDFDGAGRQLTARRLELQRDGQSPVGAEQIHLDGWATPAPDGWFTLDRLDVSGVVLTLDERSATSSTLCAELPSKVVALGREAAEPFAPLLPFFRETILKVRGDLFRVALAMAAIILGLKFLSVLWLRRWFARTLLTAIPTVTPFALYFVLRGTLSTGNLFVAAAAVLFGVAILCRVIVYRRGAKWHQRWEPFAADVASALILLPLLGYGYELPPRPAAPSGLRLGRIDVANVAGRSEGGAQFDIPQTSVTGVGLSLPGGVRNAVAFDVANVQIPAVDITASDSSRVTLDQTLVENVNVMFDRGRMEISGVSAHASFGGAFESDAVWREFRNIEFLRGVNNPVDRMAFDFDLTVAGPDLRPQVRQQFPESGNPIAVNAGVTLQPAECTGSYALAARIISRPLTLMALADGDAQNVNIRTLHSLPGSLLQIASGDGHIVMNGATRIDLNLGAIGGSVGNAQLSLGSLGFSASLPPLGQSGRQTVSVALGPTDIRPSEGWQIRFGQGNVRFDRTSARASIPVSFQTRIEDVRLEHDADVEADFPVLETTVAGRTTPEVIPRNFMGTVAFRASGGNPIDQLFGMDRPLSVNVDLWKGLIDIPEQKLTFRESIVSEALEEISVQFGLSGQVSSISPQVRAALETTVGLSGFEGMLGQTSVALNDARMTGRADWNERGASAKVSYGTGWTSVELPPGPTALCLDEISTIDIAAGGSVTRIHETGSETGVETGSERDSVLAGATRAPSTCLSLPSVPGEIRLRLSGAYPPGRQEYAVQLEGESGNGIRIKDVGNAIQNLRISNGRLTDIRTNVSVAGIQNLQGLGEFDVRANILRTGSTFEVKSSFLASDGTPLLEAALVRTPARITLDGAQHVSADRILAQLRPYLPNLNLDLGGIEPQGRFARLDVEANFEAGELLDAAAVVELAGGVIAKVDAPDLQMNISTPLSSPGPVLRLNVGRQLGSNRTRSIVFLADVSGAGVTAVTDRGVAFDVDAKVHVGARGSLFLSGEPSVSPVLNKVADVSAGLTRYASRLADIFGVGGSPQQINNIQWNLNLTQTSPALPLIRFAPDALGVNVSAASFDAAWDRPDGRERSKIAGSVALDSTISLNGNQVLLEALSPVELAFTLDGRPETRIESNLPIRVLFSDRLNQSQPGSDSLWDGDYYARFWREHPSRFSGARIVPPVDIGQLRLGPLSVRQVLFPLEPIRAIIGYSDALQVGLPISGSALFGSVAGKLESNLTLSGDAASLDTRLDLDLKNIQAGALGTAMRGTHSAVVEDELDGKVSLQLDGLTLDRNILAAMLAGKVNADVLEKISMSVRLLRSATARNLPGVLQASSDVQINLMNEVLNQILRGLRLSAPPRAMTYRDFTFDFEVARGQVRTDREIVKLGGLQIYSSDFVDVEGEVRAGLGRSGERVLLRDLIEMLGGFTAAKESEGR